MPSLEGVTVGVLGAGAMGTGIAQVAATAGHAVVVVDAFAASLDKAKQGIEKSLAREVEKGRLDQARAGDVQKRLRFETSVGEDLGAFRDCGLVIEAIVEEVSAARNFAKRFTILIRLKRFWTISRFILKP